MFIITVANEYESLSGSCTPTLNTKALLEVKKNKLGKMFIKLFENYLSSEEYVSQYNKDMEMIET